MNYICLDIENVLFYILQTQEVQYFIESKGFMTEGFGLSSNSVQNFSKFDSIFSVLENFYSNYQNQRNILDQKYQLILDVVYQEYGYIRGNAAIIDQSYQNYRNTFQESALINDIKSMENMLPRLSSIFNRYNSVNL